MLKPIGFALAVIWLALAAGSARADTTYVLALHGTDQRNYPICRVPNSPGPCDETVYLPWSGKLEVTIDSSADGFYVDADVLLFDFQSTTGSLVMPGVPGSVTVAGGQVTSVDIGNFPGADNGGSYDFNGLNVSFTRDFDPGHEVTDFASGMLSTVPEPGEGALLLLALVCGWAAATRSRRAASAV